jgi:hypothetical protein
LAMSNRGILWPWAMKGKRSSLTSLLIWPCDRRKISYNRIKWLSYKWNYWNMWWRYKDKEMKKGLDYFLFLPSITSMPIYWHEVMIYVELNGPPWDNKNLVLLLSFYDHFLPLICRCSFLWFSGFCQIHC